MIGVPRETAEKLALLESLVLAESRRQNLISAGTIPSFRERHLQDSLQLLPLLAPGPLLDIGSGAGFPGLVLACYTEEPVHLVEPRGKRAAFLAATAEALGLGHVRVHAVRVERLTLPPIATITARAVASVNDLFTMAEPLSASATRWVLPKGRTAREELEAARTSWQGDFRLVPSSTEPSAAILVATNVRRRRHR